MSEIKITHTHADGTLIEGSSKGDGVWETLKGLRDNWRYFRSLGQIGLGQSRDKAAMTHRINRAADALRAAGGHEVTVSIDESQRRTVAEIEADRAERAGARAEHYEERSERVGAQASADYARAREMGSVIPFGQPVMPDHHSYGRDMSYRRRMGRTYDRAFAAMDQAETLADRAKAAEATQAHRESIPATLRRIEKLEADLRRTERDIAGRMDWVDNGTGEYELKLVTPGPRYLAKLEVINADLEEKIAYWRGHVKAAEESGVKVWTRADFTKGDFVRTRGHWYEVERVNPKSLSVPDGTNTGQLTVVTRAEVCHAMGPSQWVRKVTYDDVTGRKSAEEMAAALAETVSA